MKNTYPHLSHSVIEVKEFFTFELLDNIIFDCSIIELDKALIDNGLADKKNRFSVMVEGILSSGDRMMCQYCHDNGEGTYTRMGSTLGFAKSVIKDIENLVDIYNGSYLKAKRSHEKGSNIYINAEKKMKSVVSALNEKWNLKLK